MERQFDMGFKWDGSNDLIMSKRLVQYNMFKLS